MCRQGMTKQCGTGPHIIRNDAASVLLPASRRAFHARTAQNPQRSANYDDAITISFTHERGAPVEAVSIRVSLIPTMKSRCRLRAKVKCRAKRFTSEYPVDKYAVARSNAMFRKMGTCMQDFPCKTAAGFCVRLYGHTDPAISAAEASTGSRTRLPRI